MSVALTIATTDYDHFRDFRFGLVRAEGIEVNWLTLGHHEIFSRFTFNREWDVSELSFAKFSTQVTRKDSDIIGLPVYASRLFRFASFYVNRKAGIRTAKDLRGKRVGVPDFSMTAAVWTRGILKEQYGVDWAEMRWVASGRQRFAALPGAPLEVGNSDLEADVVAGKLDAILTPTPEDEKKPAGQRRLRSLIADVQKAEEDYVRDYGVYPINHVVVIRDDALRRLPKLPKALFTAFADAKARAYKRRLGTTLMPWGMRHWNKVFDQFGGNPLPYGLTPLNRDVVDRLAGFLHDQKLISKKPSVDELFIAESRSFSE